MLLLAGSEDLEMEFGDMPRRLHQELRQQQRREPGQKPFGKLSSSEKIELTQSVRDNA